MAEEKTGKYIDAKGKFSIQKVLGLPEQPFVRQPEGTCGDCSSVVVADPKFLEFFFIPDHESVFAVTAV